MRKIFFSCLITCITGINCVIGQGLDLSVFSATGYQFQKFGTYPVGHFRGIPNIEIPLYTIEVGDLVVPISLKYHASGIKVNEYSGLVGLGWSLSTGGMVTANKNGLWDFEERRLEDYKSADEINYFNDANDFLYLQKGTGDNLLTIEPDCFNFEVNGVTGSFYISKENPAVPILVPYQPLKVNYISDIDSRYTDIWDTKGIHYRFGTPLDGGDVQLGGEAGLTSYLLTDIQSATDNTNNIKFSYQNGPWAKNDLNYDYFVIDDYNDLWESYGGSDWYDKMEERMDNFYNPYKNIEEWCGNVISTGGNIGFIENQGFEESRVLRMIDFKNGYVLFELNDDDMLEYIRVYDKDNTSTPIKVIHLLITTFPGSFSSTINRYKLEAIEFLNPRNEREIESDYQFTYYNEGNSMPDWETNAVDFWGYYNGKTDNTSLMHDWDAGTGRYYFDFENISDDIIGTADRNAYQDPMKYYTLHTITYPTKGWTEFLFEANKYWSDDDASVKDAGGLRVSGIINYDENGIEAGRTHYEYRNLENRVDCGEIDVIPSLDIYHETNYILMMVTGECGDWLTWRRTSISSNSYINLAPYGSPVVYPMVIEKKYKDDIIAQTTEYKFDYTRTTYNTYINNFEDVKGQPFSKKQYRYQFKDWNVGQLRSKTVTSNTSTVSTTNEYEEVIHEEMNGFKNYRFVNTIMASSMYTVGCNTFFDIKSTEYNIYDNDLFKDKKLYNYGDYKIVSGEKKLISSKERIDGVEKETSYKYNSKGQLTIAETKDSKGDLITQHTVYPTDFSPSSVETSAPWIVDMQDANMINKPIETYALKNGSEVLGGTHTVYNNGIDLGLPKSVYSLKKKSGLLFSPDAGQFEPSNYYGFYNLNEHYTLDYEVDDYEAGNLLQYHKEDDINVSYLWGYNNTYPIAKIDNAEHAEVRFDNYEDEDNPIGFRNTYDHYMRSGEEAHSGNYSWKATSHKTYKTIITEIDATNLNTDSKYVFSVWIKCDEIESGGYINISLKAFNSSGQSVDETVNYDATRLGEWQLLKAKVDLAEALTSLGTITNVKCYIKNYGPGSLELPAYYDDVRFCPADAQMTTYTYDPLVGVTSVSDNFGRVTKYDYDDFNRLEEIRDNEDFIMEKYHYHYAE